jgi:hypothetical protein
MKTLSLRYLDTCQPDYFQGFGGNVLTVYIDGKTRSGEVLKGLHDEINGTEVFLYDTQAYATDENYAQLHKSADDLFADTDKRKTFSRMAEEGCIAYFGVMVEDVEEDE